MCPSWVRPVLVSRITVVIRNLDIPRTASVADSPNIQLVRRLDLPVSVISLTFTRNREVILAESLPGTITPLPTQSVCQGRQKRCQTTKTLSPLSPAFAPCTRMPQRSRQVCKHEVRSYQPPKTGCAAGKISCYTQGTKSRPRRWGRSKRTR
ncbi:hypothetical protein BaRGS_00036664 [Batillaria attramentaria]|uniref:Uncharacterized protein n=1 Tax=Batillaria attramentaria TaxID=370345 RepID=A0ABD0JB66_9CAEN